MKIHLPAKEENVILVRLSQIQRDLYTQFMDRFRDCGSSGWLGLNPLKAFCVCCKVSGGLREDGSELSKGPRDAEDVSLRSGDVFQSYLEYHYIVKVILKFISSDSTS